MNEAESALSRDLPAGSYPPRRDQLPTFVSEDARYRCRFAQDAADLGRLQRLRFEVFNLELGEGLAESHSAGLDRDEFDGQCHHLLVERIDGGDVVGTYRMQTSEMAAAGRGFYADGEFELDALPASILESAVETGRACIAQEHRHHRVLLLLWKGLGQYSLYNHKRYIFGCCSLTTQDHRDGALALAYLRRQGYYHPTLELPVRATHRCRSDLDVEPRELKLPKLFRTYLRYGAKIVGEPAIDRAFQTIDFLALLDLHELDPAAILRQFEVDLREGR